VGIICPPLVGIWLADLSKLWGKVHIYWEGHKFCEISTLDLSYVHSSCQIYGWDFAKFHVLLRIYKLYPWGFPAMHNWNQHFEKPLENHLRKKHKLLNCVTSCQGWRLWRHTRVWIFYVTLWLEFQDLTKNQFNSNSITWFFIFKC
jgi:hypothetical protein